MVKNPFKFSNVKTYKVDYVNLSQIVDFAENCTLDKSIYNYIGTVTVRTFSNKIKKLYGFCGKALVLLDNNQLVMYNYENDEQVVMQEHIDESALILNTNLGGEQRFIYITPSKSVLGEKIINLPMGNFAVIYDGRCFVADNETLYYSGEYDFENEVFDDFGGIINFEMHDKKVSGLEVMGEYLYVFCQKAIYRIERDGQGLYKVKKLAVQVDNVAIGTVKCMGGEIFFIDNGEICSFNGNSVVRRKNQLTHFNFNRYVNAIRHNNFYAVMCMKNDDVYQFVYDIDTDLISVKRAENLICADGGLLTNENGGLILGLEKEGGVVGDVWFRTVKLDFGTPLNKSLKQVSLYSKGNVKLKISGDFGSTEFKLNDGNNVLNMNYTSNEFVLEFSSKNAQLTVDKLCVKYTI